MGALAVLAGVLALVAGVAGGGVVLNGVVRGMERALCRVAGGDCLATELAACTVRSRETGGRLGLKLTLVKLGGSLSLLREELSDGSVDVTLIDGVHAAPTAALGASGGVRLGGDRKGGGAITQAELLVRLGRRRVWHRPDAASADRLVEDIREHVAANLAEAAVPGVGTVVRGAAHAFGYDGDALPAPDVTGLDAGAEGVAQAELAATARGSAGLRTSLGGTRERATGRRTLVFSLEGEAGGALSKAVGGVALAGSRGATVSVVFDRAGEPLELAVGVAGTGIGDLRLGLPRGQAGDGTGGRAEVTARLDLARPANRAAYDGLVAALGPGGRGLREAVVVLGRQLGTSARRDVVRMATTARSYGADGELALGARVGGSVEVTRTTAALRDAWTRPAGGVWEQRTDCLARARA